MFLRQEEEAGRVFAALLRSRGEELRQDLLNDADLAGFRSSGWFQQLLQVDGDSAGQL